MAGPSSRTAPRLLVRSRQRFCGFAASGTVLAPHRWGFSLPLLTFGRAHEYTTAETIDIYAGTFNLNGKGANIKQDLSAWLCPRLGSQHRQPEIVAVGFQEIVELSPQQIMSTDPSRRQVWEQAVGVTINNRVKPPMQEEYVLLRSGQLVGAALVIFVKSSALKKIKNVEGSVKKVSGYLSRVEAQTAHEG